MTIRVKNSEPTASKSASENRCGLDEGDLLLIRERLAMTPAERLKAAQNAANALIRLQQNARRLS